MPAGRPTDYNSTVNKRARSYLASCEDVEEQQLTGVSVKGTELYRTVLKVKLPSIEGLAAFLKVHRDTLYEWAKVHPEFSDTLNEIRMQQADRVLNNGLSGAYNPTIAKLILSTNHGFSEKQELTGSGGKDLFPVPILSNMNVPTHDRNSKDSESHQTD